MRSNLHSTKKNNSRILHKILVVFWLKKEKFWIDWVSMIDIREMYICELKVQVYSKD